MNKHEISKALNVITDESILQKDINKKGEQIVMAEDLLKKIHEPNLKTDTKYNLLKYMAGHNIEIMDICDYRGNINFVLEECPFCKTYKNNNASIFISVDDIIGFKCFNKECTDKGWSDVMSLYDNDNNDAHIDANN